MNWIDQNNILFSYLTGKGLTMGVATSTESRANERTVGKAEIDFNFPIS